MAFKIKNKHKILEEFNNSRTNVTYIVEDDKKKFTRGFNKISRENSGRAKTNLYDKYKYKLDQGEIEKFNTRDILYFFKDVAEEHGNKYIIANFQVEMAKMKNIINKGYTPTDIVAMIEFLFTSGQTYLDTKSVTPGILATGWCNRIYTDTQDWLDDNFDPNKKYKKSKNTRTREWEDDGEEW